MGKYSELGEMREREVNNSILFKVQRKKADALFRIYDNIDLIILHSLEILVNIIKKPIQYSLDKCAIIL